MGVALILRLGSKNQQTGRDERVVIDLFLAISGKGEACLSKQNTFFQLINNSNDVAKVLYIVSPDYLFLMENEKVIYDDAIIVDEDWDKLKDADWYKSISPFIDRVEAYKKVKKLKHKMD